MTRVLDVENPNNPFLRGNFGPVGDELSADCEDIIGEIPNELSGAFLRIGSNPVFVDSIEDYHWFDGDGMIHEVHFKGGKAVYRNRFVRTKGLELELEHGKSLWKGLKAPPDLSNEHGLFKNAANTAMVFHAHKLLALWEGGNPTHVTLPELETIGEVDYDGKLTHPFTAHPKVDLHTGEMMTFGYNMIGPAYCHYSVIDKAGKLVRTVPIEVPKPVMMHDCAVSENYTLFLDLPVVFDMAAAMSGEQPIRWDPANGSRIGVIPRHGDAADIKWFEVETGFVFHTVNAFEEGDEVVLEACRSNQTNVVGADENTEAQEGDMPRLHQWRLNMATGQSTERSLDPVTGSEFPRINETWIGRRNRYSYNARMGDIPGGMFDGVTKYDLVEGGAEHVVYGPGRSGGESVFAPRPNGTTEDDGWVIGFVWDENEQRSECIIVDARDFSAGPVARIKLPGRVPFGFHASWVPQDWIDDQV